MAIPSSPKCRNPWLTCHLLDIKVHSPALVDIRSDLSNVNLFDHIIVTQYTTFDMFLRTFVGATLVLAPAVFAAGTGADVYTCVYYPSKPVEPVDFNFVAGSSSDEYMKFKGNDSTVIASSSGLTCTYIGYVQAADSYHDGRWSLEYAASDASRGSTSSVWETGSSGNVVTLENSQPGTYMCECQVLCNSNSYEWRRNESGKFYVCVFASEFA
jgi:hypothetical protein